MEDNQFQITGAMLVNNVVISQNEIYGNMQLVHINDEHNKINEANT